MPSISVDVRAALRALLDVLPSPADTKKIATALGAAAYANWVELASDGLQSTSRDYIQGLTKPVLLPSAPGMIVRLQLIGVLPNMVEQGWPRTDLRTTVLLSPKAKTSKAGHKYLSISFRHGAPGSGKRNVGSAMPKPIHNVARELAGTTTSYKGDPAKYRERLTTQIGDQVALRGGGTVGDLLRKRSKSWHTTSIYTDMIRKVAAYGVRKDGTPNMQSSYATFRTISAGVKNDERSWMHPGIERREYAKKVQTQIGKTAAGIVAAIAKGE